MARRKNTGKTPDFVEGQMAIMFCPSKTYGRKKVIGDLIQVCGVSIVSLQEILRITVETPDGTEVDAEAVSKLPGVYETSRVPARRKMKD